MAGLNVQGPLSPEQVLDAAKRRAVEVQAPVVGQGQFYLAGGTALALQLGHRRSRDLDWFTPVAFDEPSLVRALQSLSVAPTAVEHSAKHTVRAFYGELETSFIRFSAIAARSTVVEVGAVRLPVADIATIAAMKAGAIVQRGAKRDFVDVDAITRSPGWSMERFVDNAGQKIKLLPAQLYLGLTYFADAEKQPMPDGARDSWEAVKRSLVDQVGALQRRRTRGPDMDR